jgi:hypothetical protein
MLVRRCCVHLLLILYDNLSWQFLCILSAARVVAVCRSPDEGVRRSG